MSRRVNADDWDESDVRIRPQKKSSRPRTKERPPHEDAKQGQVISVERGRYTVLLEESSGTGTPHTVITHRARELYRTAIVVGDIVSVVGDLSGSDGSLARIVRIAERRTVLRRSADDQDPVERIIVANADQLLIVVAAADPEPRPGFIERALCAADDAGIAPILLVTKTDLHSAENLLEHFRGFKLPVVLSSFTPQKNNDSRHRLEPAALQKLESLLSSRWTVLLGPSGVGKSTLVNALTGAERNTGEVNTVTGQGRHTSSSSVALALPGGVNSWIVDTPGVRSLGLAHIPPERLAIIRENFDQMRDSTSRPG